MNTSTIVAIAVLAAVVVLAVWGSIRTFRSESCCDDDRNCCSAGTSRCSIMKDDR